MSSVLFRNILYFSSKVSFSLALLLTIITLICAWIGLIVPDWVVYTSIDGIEVKFGLWSQCKKVKNFNTQYACQAWESETSPDFLVTIQPLMALGCFFVTMAIFLAALGLFMNKGILKYLRLFAGISVFIAFLFLIVGVSVFVGDYESYILSIAGSDYSRRWGFWIYVPLLMFLLAASVMFPFNLLYKNFLTNRIYNFVHNNGKGPSSLGLDMEMPIPDVPNYMSEILQSRNGINFENSSDFGSSNHINNNPLQIQSGESRNNQQILRPDNLQPNLDQEFDYSFNNRNMNDSFVSRRSAREANYLGDQNDQIDENDQKEENYEDQDDQDDLNDQNVPNSGVFTQGYFNPALHHQNCNLEYKNIRLSSGLNLIQMVIPLKWVFGKYALVL